MSDADPGLQAPVRSHRGLLSFLVVAFAWSWGLWGWVLASGSAGRGAGSAALLLFLAPFGPLLGALVALLLEHGGRGGLLRLRRCFGPLDVGWGTWLLAVYGAVPMAIIGLLLFGAADLRETTGTAAVLLFMPFIAAFSLLPGPLGQEPGWRGLMLPWLLQRRGPLAASLLLGGLWAIWQLPLGLFPGARSGAALYLFLPLQALGTLAMSLIITVIYLRARGSVTLAVLTHASLAEVAGPFALVSARGHLATEAVVAVTLVLWVTAAALWLLPGSHRAAQSPPVSPQQQDL